MGQILAIVSSKGGVGKTTTAVNVAAAFASLDFPTLLVEADPQCSLVSNFGFDRYDIPKGLSDVARSQAQLEETTFETPVQGLHVVSSNIWSQDEEIQYLGALERDPLLLKKAMEFVRTGYDYVIVDAPPMLGPITVAVLAAADRFIVPLQTEPHAIRSLARLMEAAGMVRTRHNAGLKFDGIALTMVDSRTKLSAENANLVRAAYPEQVFSATIPRSVKLAEVQESGRPVAVSAPSSRGGRAYCSLAEEILLLHARERALEKSEELGEVDPEALVEVAQLEPAPEEEIALALIKLERSGAAGAIGAGEALRGSTAGANGSGQKDAAGLSGDTDDAEQRFFSIETLLEAEANGKPRTAVIDGEDWRDE